MKRGIRIIFVLLAIAPYASFAAAPSTSCPTGYVANGTYPVPLCGEGGVRSTPGWSASSKIFTLIKTGHLPRSVILICHSNACTSIPNRTGTVHFDVLHRLRLIQHHAVRVRVQFLPHLHVSIPYDKYTTQK